MVSGLMVRTTSVNLYLHDLQVASIPTAAVRGLCARGGVKVALHPSRLKGASLTEPAEFFVVQGGSYGREI